MHPTLDATTALPLSDLPPLVQQVIAPALAGCAMPVALYDAQDMLRYANTAFDAIYLGGHPLPLSFADVLRHSWRQALGSFIECGDIEDFLADILPRRRSAPLRQLTTDLRDGRWLQFTEMLLPGDWLLTIGSDITALKRQELDIRQAHSCALHEARTDALTGVANRRHILEAAEQALAARPACGGPCLSIALIDLDHFKRINDRYGHPIGDAVLQHFCQQAQQHLRSVDTLGRYGGEEFLVLLPGADAAAAQTIIARLHRMRANRDAALPAITLSAGIAQASSGETLGQLLQRADQALYTAKTAGRGTTVVAPSVPTEIVNTL